MAFLRSGLAKLAFTLNMETLDYNLAGDDGIFISQDNYVADILKKFDFSSVKTASTPIETNKAFLKDEEAKDVDVHLYRSMIGSLINKKDERGIVIRNKAKLVAQGYTQEKGIDYDEVFAPVARIKAITLFLAYASFKDFVVYQMDVKSAFLYGKIKEEVYVCQPPGFEDPEFPNKIYKVEKALYGLHQAPRAWYETLSTYLLDNGFQRTASTLMETSKPLLKDAEAEDVDVHLYRSMIGSLMYLTTSRPDIMFVDSPFDLEAYTDSDYAGESLDMKSTTGGCQFFGRRLISWQCKKQTIIANSTTKAEYVAAASCCGQTKHIEIRHHFIRDSNEKKLIQMIKIHTDHNVADLLTKAFDVRRF
ncbi:putative ribonuclease H-like domain-containing protein [Tanacetum coccineum]